MGIYSKITQSEWLRFAGVNLDHSPAAESNSVKFMDSKAPIGVSGRRADVVKQNTSSCRTHTILLSDTGVAVSNCLVPGTRIPSTGEAATSWWSQGWDSNKHATKKVRKIHEPV